METMPRADYLEVPMMSPADRLQRDPRMPAERMRSSFLQRLEAVSLSGLSRHHSLHDLVDSDSDVRETSPGSTGLPLGLPASRPTTLERPSADVHHRSVLSRPQPLLEEAEARLHSHKVQGSPSELSTATTVPGEDGNELQGETVQRLTSPVGSSGLASDVGCAGDTCAVWQGEDPLVTMARRLKGPQDAPKMVSEIELPVKVVSNGRIDARALREASTQELDQSLSLATSQARRLWKSVEDSTQLVNELQARMNGNATGSRHRSAGSCHTKQAPDLELKLAQEEECKLREKVAILETSRKQMGQDETRRKSTRLRARLARLEQEREEVSEEVSFYRKSCRQLEAEAESLRSTVRLREEEMKRNKEMEARLKLQLMSLLPRPVAEESLSDLARLVGRTWAESRSAGEARRSEMMSLKEHRQKLEIQIVDAQAKIESDTKKLLRAEEELALLKSERQAQGRLVTEELAMARAENKLLNEDRSLWLQTRPRLLNLLEDLKHGRSISAPNTASVQAADQALQAAEQEKQELQAMLQQLEKDKATLIQEQEDMIRRVRERVDPLQDRVAQQSRVSSS